MNFLMLRGQIPQDRDPQEIVFNKLNEVDDMWTLLFYSMMAEEDYGELWYWGGKRKKQFTTNFVERWVSNFHDYDPNRGANAKDPGFIPEVIFCRGGFPQYHSVLKRFPNAIKIYYGAGARFLPQPGFTDYDIILQDSEGQLKECEKKFPKALTTLFVKPAADNLFYPRDCEKTYDVCFPANAAQDFKGHKFVYRTVPKDLSMLNLGNKPDRYKRPPNVDSKRVLRTHMAENICKCRVGIVAANSKRDSCPRVIPEMLACDIPVIVRRGTRFWVDKYVNNPYSSRSPYATGELTNDEEFWEVVRFVLHNIEMYSPRKYYDQYLSLSVAGKFLREKVDEVSV